MIVFLLFFFVSNSIAEDDLRNILKSPKATLQLYSTFKSGNGLKYSGNEDGMRFRLFLKNAEFVADLSERDHAATYALNRFSSMTNDEKKHYLGFNSTQKVKERLPLRRFQSSELPQPPPYKLWTNLGAVTEVKEQDGCGSCWTFGPVGALETAYFKMTGVLRNFAEQEYLDCVYEGNRDGCKGGMHGQCYWYSMTNGNRLASTADYKYTAKDGPCLKDSKPNAMVAAELTNYDYVIGQRERHNIAALAEGAISMAFQVTAATYQYSSGIFKDISCGNWPNHVVTAVGYTPEYVLVKNSWGPKWGDQGFIKFTRNYRNCGLFEHSLYPMMTLTGKADNTPSDAATSYRTEEPKEDKSDIKPPCKDLYKRCKADFCKRNTPWLKKNCAKTCNKCDECPPGTQLCGDGVCRHEHMCH